MKKESPSTRSGGRKVGRLFTEVPEQLLEAVPLRWLSSPARWRRLTEDPGEATQHAQAAAGSS